MGDWDMKELALQTAEKCYLIHMGWICQSGSNRLKTRKRNSKLQKY